MIKNCTPHDVNLVDSVGNIIHIFEKTGIIPRVEEKNELARDFSCPIRSGEENYDYIDTVNCTAVRKVLLGVKDLPSPQEGILYLVSSFVFGATERNDVVAPDTGPESAVRNEKGHIIGVRRFIVK